MAYSARDFSKLVGMPGLSERLLKNHFTLYQGYVTNTNRLLDLTMKLAKEAPDSPEFAETRRRLGFEFDGMRLHEYYFENLGGNGSLNKSGPLATKMAEDFGSYEDWDKDFRATGMSRGIGWAILYEDNVTGRLINIWVNEHQTNHLAGCKPLLVMDAWEHAFMVDYDTKRAPYIEAFFKNIDWGAVEFRLQQKAPAYLRTG